MMLRQSLLLMSYLVEASTKQFQWGQWDCNLFMTKWVDRLLEVNSSDEIQSKYTTALGAARFYKNYMTVPQYLAKWQHKPATGPARTGDFILEHDRLWVVPYIVLNNYAYTIHHDHNLIHVNVDDLADLEIWRI